MSIKKKKRKLNQWRPTKMNRLATITGEYKESLVNLAGPCGQYINIIVLKMIMKHTTQRGFVAK